MTVHCGSVSDSGCERRDQKRLKAARRNTPKKLLKLVIFVICRRKDGHVAMT